MGSIIWIRNGHYLLLKFRLSNQGNHGFLGPKSDLALLNNRKRCRLIAKQIHVCVLVASKKYNTPSEVLPNALKMWDFFTSKGVEHFTRGISLSYNIQPIELLICPRASGEKSIFLWHHNRDKLVSRVSYLVQHIH